MMNSKIRGEEYQACEFCKNILKIDDFIVSDKPDIISLSNNIGIEVVQATDPEERKLEDAFFKKQKPKEKIHFNSEKHNLIEEPVRMITSSHGSEEDFMSEIIGLIKTNIQKKIIKSKGYKEVDKLGLFIYSVSPTSISDVNERLKIFKDIFHNQMLMTNEDSRLYDFMIFCLIDTNSCIFVSSNKVYEKSFDRKQFFEIYDKACETIKLQKEENNK